MRVLLAFPENLLGKLILEAIHLQPGVEVVPCFSRANEHLSSPLPAGFDLALIYADSAAHGTFGFSLLRRFRERLPLTKCVVMFDEVTRGLTTRAFSLGARGVLSTATCDLRQLCRCIAQVNAGQIWANTAQVGWMMEELSSVRVENSEHYRETGRLDDVLLSRREAEVIDLLARGNTNREIAHTLNLSEHTIKNYLSRIFDKAGVSSRTELMAHTMKGIVEAPTARNQWYSNRPALPPPLSFRKPTSRIGSHEELGRTFVQFPKREERLDESPVEELRRRKLPRRRTEST